MLSEEGFDALGAEGIEDFLYYLERKGTEVLHQINKILPIDGIGELRFYKLESDGAIVFKGNDHYNHYRYEFPASYLFSNDWMEGMEEEAKRRKEHEALMAEATEENRLSTLRGLMEKYPEEVLNYKVKLVG
jgi:hypothetical protein